ncbi:MAG TPA: hypothetical protein VGQ31_01850 [Candidatus Limnocylindrales bacterium]|jgi:hypothetical protein|nr:hypothetical protein [Candidatus Limnocylindrales bacterium]
MPELPVKEVRPSELHLPEIKREEIVRALSDIRMPEVRMPDVDLSRIERPDVDQATKSLGRMATAAAVALHLIPRARRPRWPLAVGGLIVAGVAVAVLTNQAVRARLSAGAAAVRERVSAMRPETDQTLDVGPDEAVAFDAAETATIETSPFADATPIDATGYPAGLGVDQDGSKTLEEAHAGD